MFAANSKNIVRVILRNRGTRILLATVFLVILFSTGEYFRTAPFLSSPADPYTTRNYFKYIYNVVYAIGNVLALFIIPICSFTVSYDEKNAFRDVQRSTLLKTRTYYLSALFTYFVFFFLITICSVSLLLCATFLSPHLQMPVVMSDLLFRVARNVLLIAAPSILTYISVSVGLTLLTDKPAAGVAGGLLYWMVPQFLGLSVWENLFWFPNKIDYYLYYYDSPFIGDFTDNASRFRTSSREAFLCYLLIFAIDFFLLAAGYAALKKREGKS